MMTACLALLSGFSDLRLPCCLYVTLAKVVDNSTRPNNGVVTMKGKGEVQTWVAWQNFKAVRFGT